LINAELVFSIIEFKGEIGRLLLINIAMACARPPRTTEAIGYTKVRIY
jgi:hypothetical protein